MKKTLVIFILCIIIFSVLLNTRPFIDKLYNHYPGLSLQYISRKVTGGEIGSVKKIERLLGYIHTNVFKGEFEAQDTPPLDILIRGIGWCDQVSHVFIRLIEPLDIKGYLVFLKELKDGKPISPHSVAVITPEEKEKLTYERLFKEGGVVDVLQGVLFKNRSGKVATAQELCTGSFMETQSRYFKSYSNTLYCNEFQIFLSNTPQSAIGKKKQFFYSKVFPYIPDFIMHIYQDMVLEKVYKKRFDKAIDYVYFKARNYHVYDRLDEALVLYDKVINSKEGIALVQETLFFKAMLLVRNKQLPLAIEIFGDLLEKYPDSAWSALAREWQDTISDATYMERIK